LQPVYDICWSRSFIEDVKRICGDLRVFDEAFTGYDYNLSRLPRGPGTWDLSVTGDYRMAHMAAHKLPDGTDVPAILFTFRLELSPTARLELLRAYRSNDPALS
jgi:hypothetical protein